MKRRLLGSCFLIAIDEVSDTAMRQITLLISESNDGLLREYVKANVPVEVLLREKIGIDSGRCLHHVNLSGEIEQLLSCVALKSKHAREYQIIHLATVHLLRQIPVCV